MQQATAMIVNVRVRWRLLQSTLLLLLLLCPKDSVSFSVDTPPLVELHHTRRCTLYSHDGEHIIGTILERRSSDGVYEATIDSGSISMKEGAATDDSSISQSVLLPYIETADRVGSSTWPSALVGAILLHCSQELQELTKDSEVLELGSGLGLGGLVAGKHASRCVLSDNDEELVELLGQHLAKHKGIGDHFSVQHLDWRDSDPSNAPEKEDRFDICLGFDVAYYYHLMGPLINTMRVKLKTDKATMLIVGQAYRESQWQLFHHIRDGGYNQITDEHEAPWDGSTRMLLYKLEMGTWSDGKTGGETDCIDGFVPIAALLQTPMGVSVSSITPYDHIATGEDEKSQMMSF